ncbi:MAG: fused MFS/spermidine synthase, partial [Gemmataceae bacterium]
VTAVLWAGGAFKSPYQMETNYFAIRVQDGEFQGEKVKTLALDHLIHSHVKLGDPTYLGYPHEKSQSEFVRAVAAGPDPRVLVIGGGGYTLPRWVEVTEPAVKVDVVEIDPGVTLAAKRYLNLTADTKIVTYNQDGRQFIQEVAAPGSYPLVIGDAVNDMSVPFHIMTREFNDGVKKVLTPGGVYLLSVVDDYEDGELLRAALRTMRLTFRHVHLVGSGPVWRPLPGKDAVGRVVFIVYGSDRPMDHAALVRAVKERAGGDAITAVQPADETQAYTDKLPRTVLTDAYAPVDNLFTVVFRKR